ncbi:MAG TPA: hypothetical protein VFF15_00445 [Flavobacteriaceae bacterium]|nr:hypothetical protein [Flavobacteriaceae bacterium]
MKRLIVSTLLLLAATFIFSQGNYGNSDANVKSTQEMEEYVNYNIS